MSDQISTRTLAPYLAVVLSACWTGAAPVEHTVEKPSEEVHVTTDVKKTFEGTLALHDGILVIDDKDHWRHQFSEPGTPSLVGCKARVTTRDDRIEQIEMLDENCPYTYVGPVESLRGTFAIEIGAAGSKMAGVRHVFFDAEDGERFGVLGQSSPTTGSVVTVRARKLTANMAYAARMTERDVWIQN